MGPYFWDSLWSAWCGKFPSKWRLPITGKGIGPGGKLLRRTPMMYRRNNNTPVIMKIKKINMLNENIVCVSWIVSQKTQVSYIVGVDVDVI